MTREDTRAEDDAGRPGDGESHPEPLPDGGSDDPGDEPQRTDGSGETNAGFPGLGDEGGDGQAAGTLEFTGFDFDTWMEQTEPEETGVEETADPEAAYSGFGFQEWMDDEDIAPEAPAEPTGATGSRAESASLLALLPFLGDSERVESGPSRFQFADWLGEGDTRYVDRKSVV